MLGWLHNLFGRPLFGVMAALGLALMVGLVWRQIRDRERRRLYRQRERQRRDYWGFD